MKDIHFLEDDLNKVMQHKSNGPYRVSVRNIDDTVDIYDNVAAISYNESILALFSENKWAKYYRIKHLVSWGIDWE